jgi:hypothetical protein
MFGMRHIVPLLLKIRREKSAVDPSRGSSYLR